MSLLTISGLWKALASRKRLFLLAGPCVIESERHPHLVARRLKAITGRLGLPFVFKASYDKANRSSLGSYRGPGMERGLEILASVRSREGVPILTDVHEVDAGGERGRRWPTSSRSRPSCAARPTSCSRRRARARSSTSRRASSWPPGT